MINVSFTRLLILFYGNHFFSLPLLIAMPGSRASCPALALASGFSSAMFSFGVSGSPSSGHGCPVIV